MHDACLAHVRRRHETFVSTAALQERMDFADSVLRMHATTLVRCAYTDGTVFDLGRQEMRLESTTRAALARCPDASRSPCRNVHSGRYSGRYSGRWETCGSGTVDVGDSSGSVSWDPSKSDSSSTV